VADDVLALEQVGYDVWRAPEVEELDGWRLRFAHGITGRANSVWPNADGGTLLLERKIEHAERWYTARGQRTLFQLTAAARPDGLAGALTARGYTRPNSPVCVETAALRDGAQPRGVEVREEPSDDWIALWSEGRGFADAALARALLTGSPGRTAFARVDDVAVGRGAAVGGGWLGVTSMFTAPHARGRGHGRAILRALVAWARANGCTRGLLQVESTNVPARALYESEGFRAQHEYRYAVAP
jgi:GNAT superfamily N-acetyltransferase